MINAKAALNRALTLWLPRRRHFADGGLADRTVAAYAELECDDQQGALGKQAEADLDQKILARRTGNNLTVTNSGELAKASENFARAHLARVAAIQAGQGGNFVSQDNWEEALANAEWFRNLEMHSAADAATQEADAIARALGMGR